MKPNKLLMIISTICIHTISIAQNYGPPQGPPPNNQENDIIQPSGYISVNFGFATPEGGFANSGNSYGGYALPGDVFHFSIGVPINHSNFGIAFMFGNYNNQYNLNAYANNNSEYAIYPNQNYYSENSIMVGLYTTYPFGRFSLDGRFMIGALLSGLPEQNVGYNDVEGDSYENDLQPSNSTSLATQPSTGSFNIVWDGDMVQSTAIGTGLVYRTTRAPGTWGGLVLLDENFLGTTTDYYYAFDQAGNTRTCHKPTNTGPGPGGIYSMAFALLLQNAGQPYRARMFSGGQTDLRGVPHST